MSDMVFCSEKSPMSSTVATLSVAAELLRDALPLTALTHHANTGEQVNSHLFIIQKPPKYAMVFIDIVKKYFNHDIKITSKSCVIYNL